MSSTRARNAIDSVQERKVMVWARSDKHTGSPNRIILRAINDEFLKNSH